MAAWVTIAAPMPMLKTRLITATPLVAAVLALVWLAPSAVLAGLFWLLALVSAWEWARLGGASRPWQQGLFVMLLGGLLGVAWVGQVASLTGWQLPGLLWWLAIFLLLIAQSRRKTPLILPRWVLLGAGLITLGLAWLGLVAVASKAQGAFWLTALFVLVWGADIGAYFIGRRFGRHALAARLSPGKTWEGVAGGLGLGLLLMLGWAAWGANAYAIDLSLSWLMPVSVMVIVSAVMGDLAESLLKRQANSKDSGWILPGHGGVLDRVDALLAAAPVMAAALVGLV